MTTQVGSATHRNLISNARSEIDHGRFTQADALLREVLKASPKDGEATALMGVIALRLGKIGQATQWLQIATAALPKAPAAANNLGVAYFSAGRNAQAIEQYKRALELQPDYPEANCNLGRAYAREQHRPLASRYLKRAIAQAPNYVDAYLELGNLQIQSGDRENGLGTLRKARELAPDSIQPVMVMARCYSEIDKLDKADQLYREAQEMAPDNVEPSFARGLMYQGKHDLESALAAYDGALRLQPNHLPSLNNSANCLNELGRFEESEQRLRHALQKAPKFISALLNLGRVLHKQGQLEEARDMLLRGIELEPGNPDLRVAAGKVFMDMLDGPKALEQLLAATELAPSNPIAWADLGTLRMQIGDYDAAQAALEKAIDLAPTLFAAHNSLGVTKLTQGDIPGSIPHFRKALELHPNYRGAASNILYANNFYDQASPTELANLHFELGRKFLPEHPAEPPTPYSHERIRVGIVSADFKQHSVAYFLLPLLEGLDRGRFTVYCYSSNHFTDRITSEIQGHADHWRQIAEVTDEAAAQQIREDEIDLLVDLSGHTGGGRLPLFGLKPAPVQATWLGYPNTSGVPTIDYRVSDQYADPAPEADALNSETLTRLPGGFLCYRPPEKTPEVAPPPALGNGYLTFGSFNNLSKLSASAIALWCDVLKEFGDARLFVKSGQIRNPVMRERLLQALADGGVARDRVTLAERTDSVYDHLALYNKVDIALDTFPYNGTTTTCEALWMGVPVIAPPGRDHRSRVTSSILANAGLPELIVKDRDDLFAKLHGFAEQTQALVDLRERIRPTMSGSPLMSIERFCSEMAEAFEHMLAGKA